MIVPITELQIKNMDRIRSSAMRFDYERTLDQLFSDAAVRAFGDSAASFDPAIRPSRHADYQANGALALAKDLGRNPREIATELTEAIDDTEIIDSTEVAGPGFVNITLKTEYLTYMTRQLSNEDRLGLDTEGEHHTYVVDYSGPNIAKSMHIGHLRTTIIGDAIVRMLEATGQDVSRQNHLGDWGTQFGMLIEYLEEHEDAASTARSAVDDLDSLYRAARKRFDSDETFADRSRDRVVALQSGDPHTLSLWQILVDTSLESFRNVYNMLGVTLRPEHDRGESFYNDQLDATVEDLRAQGLLFEDDGALCVNPPGFVGRNGEPFTLIVRKSGGGYGYVATDLATVRYSVDVLHGDRLVYITDARQAQHFHMVFAIARQAGWIDDTVETSHIGYGMVMGSDGRPFKSRSGEVVKLVDLLDEAIGRAETALTDRTSDLNQTDRERIARAVGIGALKWFDLKNEHTGNYVFDFDRMLAFSGNTGPYVQYASTRAKSVVRRSGIQGNEEIRLIEDAERALGLHLPQFGAAVHTSIEKYEPHHLCTYLYELADRFTTFYEKCPVMNASDQSIRSSRTSLCALTARVLDRGLELLGIEPLERM